MTPNSKGLLGAAALLLGSASITIGVTSKASWNKNNPIAKAWLSENNFSPKGTDKIEDFEAGSNNGWFALGCHKVLFGGQNFKKLYEDNSVTSTPTKNSQRNLDKSTLSISDLFKGDNELLLGCSTAYLKEDNSKKVYQYELALKQGDKGFDERISVHEDKIVSQLVFYEKDKNSNKYKHLFGLYRYIKKDSSSSNTYKVANPNSSNTDKWSNLNLSSGNSETKARYYSFWVDDSEGEGIFDNLGVKLDGKQFSSVVKEQNNSTTGVSDFVYTNSKDNANELQKITIPQNHYDLSVLDELANSIQGKKGFWKPAKEFCENKPRDDERQSLSEVQRLSQYCYEVKKETTTASTPQSKTT